jgi:hypothetical protein
MGVITLRSNKISSMGSLGVRMGHVRPTSLPTRVQACETAAKPKRVHKQIQLFFRGSDLRKRRRRTNAGAPVWLYLTSP